MSNEPNGALSRGGKLTIAALVAVLVFAGVIAVSSGREEARDVRAYERWLVEVESTFDAPLLVAGQALESWEDEGNITSLQNELDRATAQLAREYVEAERLYIQLSEGGPGMWAGRNHLDEAHSAYRDSIYYRLEAIERVRECALRLDEGECMRAEHRFEAAEDAFERAFDINRNWPWFGSGTTPPERFQDQVVMQPEWWQFPS